MTEIEKQIMHACLSLHPTEYELKVKVLEDERDSLVVRVYSKIPKMHPSPYCNLRFDKRSRQLSELSSQERGRFVIENYK